MMKKLNVLLLGLLTVIILLVVSCAPGQGFAGKAFALPQDKTVTSCTETASGTTIVQGSGKKVMTITNSDGCDSRNKYHDYSCPKPGVQRDQATQCTSNERCVNNTFKPCVAIALPCPNGQQRFARELSDREGVCGTREGAESFCLSHHIYISNPPEGTFCYFRSGDYGSVDSQRITGEYECLLDLSDPIFSTSPPSGACPGGSSLLSGNLLQYLCHSDSPIIGSCAAGYELTGSATPSEGWRDYVIWCGLGGFRFPEQASADQYASCGTSGARAIGGSGSSYCCAYLRS